MHVIQTAPTVVRRTERESVTAVVYRLSSNMMWYRKDVSVQVRVRHIARLAASQRDQDHVTDVTLDMDPITLLSGLVNRVIHIARTVAMVTAPDGATEAAALDIHLMTSLNFARGHQVHLKVVH